MTNDFGLCGNCIHYLKEPNKFKEGTCHRYPPTVTPVMVGMTQGLTNNPQPMINLFSNYPPVGNESVGCFEFDKLATYEVWCNQCGTKEPTTTPELKSCLKCNGPVTVKET